MYSSSGDPMLCSGDPNIGLKHFAEVRDQSGWPKAISVCLDALEGTKTYRQTSGHRDDRCICDHVYLPKNSTIYGKQSWNKQKD